MLNLKMAREYVQTNTSVKSQTNIHPTSQFLMHISTNREVYGRPPAAKSGPGTLQTSSFLL